MNNNKKKQKQLGMPWGTAMGRLRKNILFNLLQRHQEDMCYRCNKKIENIEELSIEHKKPWLDNSVDLFWDLDNISFSHLKCNIADSRGRRIDYPKGQKWCKRCKQFKNINLFPECAKKDRGVVCTKCNSERMSDYRRRKKLN